jgi:hypothetical protein
LLAVKGDRTLPEKMLTDIAIEGFRGFSRLRIPGLTRVNLIVGRNNAGKTSVLEAVEVLAGGGSPYQLFRGPSRREEGGLSDEEDRYSPTMDIRHAFSGHQLVVGSKLEISGQDGGRVFSSFEVVPDKSRRSSAQQQLEFLERAESPEEFPLALICRGTRFPSEITFPLDVPRSSPTRAGEIEAQALVPQRPVYFLGTEGMLAHLLSRVWDKVVLTPEEDRTIAALQILIPSLERIAIVGRDREPRWRSSSRIQGVRIKLKGNEDPVPLGSMGEGSRRLLYLALSMSQATDGFLLVDEIDTGLHYSALLKMWKLVTESARLLNVQVLATSHSSDCINALAELADSERSIQNTVSLHRVEPNTEMATRYSASEIRLAVERHIEMRG